MKRLCFAVLLSSQIGLPALAQEEPQPYPETVPVKAAEPEAPPLPAGDSATRLDDVTVTATKREESSRAIASSVSVLTGEEMENLGLRDVDDIVNQVPGLNIWDLQNGTTPKRITVRGISAEQSTAATTGVFLDETPFTDPVAPKAVLDMYPFDLYSVEVLKGPVGTLFGGSGLNGAIRYIPQPPEFSQWGLKAFGEIGETRKGGIARTWGGAVNAPLFGRDDLAMRVVATDRHTPGFMDSVHPEYRQADINTTDQQTQRAIVRWDPLSPLALSLMYVNQKTALDDVYRFTEKCCHALERTATPRPSPNLNEYQLYNVKGTWGFDWADAVANVARIDKSGGLEADLSFLGDAEEPPRTLNLPDVYDGTSYVGELRLVSRDDGGRWDWLIGGFDYRYHVHEIASLESENGTLSDATGPAAAGPNAIPGFQNVFLDQAGNAQALTVDGDFKVTEQALFGEANFRFAENFELTGGLRAYRFSYDVFVLTSSAGCVLVDPSCPSDGFVATSHPTSTEPGINPKVALKWQARRNLLSYVSLAKGYRFGGVNIIPHPESPTSYTSDSLWNLEVGARTDWFDGSLITDLAAYGIRWSDAQVSVTSSDGSVVFIDNVGAVEGRGVEAQLIWLTPVPGVRLTVVPAYADIRTAAPFSSGGRNVEPGTQWPLAPRLQTLTTLSWAGPLFGVAELSTALTHRYSSTAPQALVNNRLEVLGFATYGFSLTLKSFAASAWPELSFNLNNLSDVRGTIHVHANPDGHLLTATNEPRSATLRLTFHY